MVWWVVYIHTVLTVCIYVDVIQQSDKHTDRHTVHKVTTDKVTTRVRLAKSIFMYILKQQEFSVLFVIVCKCCVGGHKQ